MAEVNKTTHFYGKPDDVLYLSDYQNLTNFKEIVINLLPRVKFREKENNLYSLEILNIQNNTYMPEEKWVIVDGICTDNLAYAAKLGSKDINKIEIIYSEIMYGDLTFNGMLAIQTKNPNSGHNIPEGSLVWKNEVALEDNKTGNNSFCNTNNAHDHPDVRQCLFWNPCIIISKNNTETIEFCASPLSAIYSIDIQGITSTGTPLNKTINIEVKNDW